MDELLYSYVLSGCFSFLKIIYLFNYLLEDDEQSKRRLLVLLCLPFQTNPQIKIPLENQSIISGVLVS